VEGSGREAGQLDSRHARTITTQRVVMEPDSIGWGAQGQDTSGLHPPALLHSPQRPTSSAQPQNRQSRRAVCVCAGNNSRDGSRGFLVRRVRGAATAERRGEASC